jgi:TolB-like protein
MPELPAGGLIAVSVRRPCARHRAPRVAPRRRAGRPGAAGLRPPPLLQNRERVVSKDDLLASVWGGRIVSDATLDSRITAARRAVGDSGAAQTLIRTFARKGVRFVGEVREEGKPAAFAPEMAADPKRAELALPDKPSIAVLPFANLSGDPEQEYFVDGMVEEIITALSRIRWLFVIARNSSFTYKGQAIDVKRVGRELGVRYVLEGSVRKGGNRVRISAQLIDTENRGPSLGGPLRRLARRCVRLAEQGRDFRCRDHRAHVARRRNRPLGAPPDERSQRLRPLSPRLFIVLHLSDAGGAGAAQGGDS